MEIEDSVYTVIRDYLNILNHIDTIKNMIDTIDDHYASNHESEVEPQSFFIKTLENLANEVFQIKQLAMGMHIGLNISMEPEEKAIFSEEDMIIITTSSYVFLEYMEAKRITGIYTIRKFLYSLMRMIYALQNNINDRINKITDNNVDQNVGTVNQDRNVQDLRHHGHNLEFRGTFHSGFGGGFTVDANTTDTNVVSAATRTTNAVVDRSVLSESILSEEIRSMEDFTDFMGDSVDFDEDEDTTEQPEIPDAPF